MRVLGWEGLGQNGALYGAARVVECLGLPCALHCAFLSCLTSLNPCSTPLVGISVSILQMRKLMLGKV